MKKGIHVVPRGDGWAAERERAKRAIAVTPTKREAEAIARDMAKKDGVELTIHRQDRDSFGNDPCPPKDKKR